MEFLFVLLGILLGVLFFLNIKSTATILCRIVGGFAFLIIYDTIAQSIGLPILGTNLFSASVCGILGLPGGLLLLCLNL